MATINVTLDPLSLAINALLIAIIPAIFPIAIAQLATGAVGRPLAIISASLLLGLSGFVLFQGLYGRIIVENDVITVKAGFYSSTWGRNDLAAAEKALEASKPIYRHNGVAMYNYRAGWYGNANSEVFMLTTTDSKVCIRSSEGKTLCLDQGVVDKLRNLLSNG